MTNYNPRHLPSLEVLAQSSFNVLSHAAHEKYPFAAETAANLYELFGERLQKATRSSVKVFLNWRRKSQRARLFDRYILQYALGSAAVIGSDKKKDDEEPRILIEWISPTPKFPHLTDKDYKMALEPVKKLIDLTKDTRYRDVYKMSEELSKKGFFDLIIGGLGYIQDNYPMRRRQ